MSRTSNYIKSAEIKIAKNPNMSEEEKAILMQEARDKRTRLAVKLGMAQKVYISSADYLRGFDTSITYTIDDSVPTYTTPNAWNTATYTTATINYDNLWQPFEYDVAGVWRR